MYVYWLPQRNKMLNFLQYKAKVCDNEQLCHFLKRYIDDEF